MQTIFESAQDGDLCRTVSSESTPSWFSQWARRAKSIVYFIVHAHFSETQRVLSTARHQVGSLATVVQRFSDAWQIHILKKLLCVLFVLIPVVQADIYRYVDENGNVTFTNQAIKGAQRILVERAPIRTNTKKSERLSGSFSPSHFPRINPEAQKERDIGRKRILEDELANEMRLLADAQKALADLQANQTKQDKQSLSKHTQRIEHLQSNIMLHEKNMIALKTELHRIR